MASQLARNLLIEQRRRLVGSLMSYLEAEVFPSLNDRQQKALRAKVLGATSQYHDVCLDLMKSTVSDGTVVNDEAISLLARQIADQIR